MVLFGATCGIVLLFWADKTYSIRIQLVPYSLTRATPACGSTPYLLPIRHRMIAKSGFKSTNCAISSYTLKGTSFKSNNIVISYISFCKYWFNVITTLSGTPYLRAKRAVRCGSSRGLYTISYGWMSSYSALYNVDAALFFFAYASSVKRPLNGYKVTISFTIYHLPLSTVAIVSTREKFRFTITTSFAGVLLLLLLLLELVGEDVFCPLMRYSHTITPCSVTTDRGCFMPTTMFGPHPALSSRTTFGEGWM